MLESVSIANWDRSVEETLLLKKVTNGIKIQDIKGLGPVASNINTSPKIQGAGSNRNSTTVGDRNIVFTFGLKAGGGRTVESVRHDIYNYFPVGEEVELIFQSGSDRWQIFGVVETVDPEIFTKDPSVQVSMICTDPYFMRYPWANQVLVLPSTGALAPVVYGGRVATGFEIDIEITAAVASSEIMGRIEFIQDTSTLQGRGFNIHEFDLQGILGFENRRLIPGDRIHVSSVQGRKSAVLYRGTNEYNIVGAVKNNKGIFLNQEQWPMVFPKQTSQFKYSSDIYPLNQIKVTMQWHELVEGL